MNAESVLLIEVPEAEPFIGDLRMRYDPVASQGVPAHITVLFPFKAPHLINKEDLEALTQVFADVAPFDFQLVRADKFPGVWYLAPEPATAFKALTRAVVARFPEYPPYGGAHGEDSTPHLTIGHSADPAILAAIGAELAPSCEGALPIRSRAAIVLLMDNADGPWVVRRSFALGRA
jgi:2'-5' RNA ligase